MAFEDIECVGPPSVSKAPLPGSGVACQVRKLGKRGPMGGHVVYIRLSIGAALARAIALTQPEHRVRLQFGNLMDRGKVQVSVDGEAGRFLAKRDKAGNYALSINAATAAGLFSLAFAPFTDPRCEAISPLNGQPRYFVFKLSQDMLSIAEDEV